MEINLVRFNSITSSTYKPENSISVFFKYILLEHSFIIKGRYVDEDYNYDIIDNMIYSLQLFYATFNQK